jgi:hypothetical protein
VRILGRSRKRKGRDGREAREGRPVQPPAPLAVGATAPDIRGESPAGEPIAVDVGAGATVLVFLTSDCQECRGLWRGMATGVPPGNARVVLVTTDASTQSRRDLEGVLPPGQVAVMSSAAWHAYGMTKAPWTAVVVDATVVASEPGGSDWGELLARAERAAAAAAGRPGQAR